MDRRAAVLALAGLIAVGLSGPAPAEDARAVLAPTGTLRIGVYPGSPTSLVRDKSGQAHGVTVELGEALGRRLGVPVTFVETTRIAEVLDGIAASRLDFTVSNATPARAETVTFSDPVLAIELGYLVPANSPLTGPEDLDAPGRRIGVTQGSTSQRTLSGRLTRASILPVPNVTRAGEMLRAGEIDAYATNKAILFEVSDTVPGSRILPGRWGVEKLAIAIPKGREAALDDLRRFVEDSRSTGLVAGAATRAGLRGAAPDE